MKSRTGQLAVSGGVLAAVAMMAVLTAGPASGRADDRCLYERQTVSGNTGTNGPDVIIGTTGPDEIDGRGGADLICAKNGNDSVFGGPGADNLRGDAGEDYVDGEGGDDKVRGNLGDDGGPGDIIVCRGIICEARGAGGGDPRPGLFGGAGDDYLQGGDGSDFLTGEGDDDEHRGGPGRDICDDNEGTNTFRSCDQPR
jgi:Ca2+-binding RTX toxin-like protein